jgi:uncharacterized protein YigE (DUF2233 family)
MRKSLIALAVSVAWVGSSAATTCEYMKFGGHRYAVCVVDTRVEKLEVFWLDDSGSPFGDMPTLSAWLAARGKQLVFAMNAGIFQGGSPFKPRGLLVSEGKVLSKIDLGDKDERGKKGNFYDKPNGIFWVQSGIAHIDESGAYNKLQQAPDLATQSGPLLVVNRKLRDGIDQMRASRYTRNGVFIGSENQTRFAITRDVVTLAEFGVFMRDGLKCTSALYLDGCGSILHSAELRRSDLGDCIRGGTLAKAGAMIGVAIDVQPAVPEGKP